MNIPKRLYPHLYEYELLMAEGRELAANMYATKNEREFEYECTEIYKTKLYRVQILGTDKEIHKIWE
jgi:hypothetical protein